MKIKYVKIVNFRSIENIQVDFEPTCRVLVGINESGKSNILRALSMISNEVTPTKEDIREALPTEKPIEESSVTFVFKTEPQEVKQVYSNIKNKVLANDINTPFLKTEKRQRLTLKDFCEIRNEGLYTINVKEQSKSEQYWTLSGGYEALKNWKKPSKSCPADFAIEKKGEQIKIVDCVLVNSSDYEIPQDYLEDIDAEYINELIGEQITEIVKSGLPELIWWEYKEENLLQPSINLDAFAADPNTNIPLKNMFALAGIDNIQQEINEAKVKSSNALRNLLKRVSNHATRHFRSVWKEYRDVKFMLEPNANNIDAGVIEKNFWNVRQRSDGFKRFITFLLLISAQERTKKLKKALILIDEPDVSLHPSGAKYLRDELINISKNNCVAYSTHSIFMIDRDTIGRHIIVKKKDEKTDIESADVSNIFNEEVLYNAVGSSVFEVLKEENIIFEGWRDKNLFKISMSRMPAKHKSVKQFFNNFGYCHAQGARDLKRITPMLELADRNCLIISDADEPAKEEQRKYQKSKGYGQWKRYDEINSSLNIVTGEDFIKESILVSIIQKVKEELGIDENPNLSDSKGRVYALKKWLTDAGIKEQSRKKEIIDQIKSKIFAYLKAHDIDDKYYVFLESLKEFLESKGGR